MSNAAIMFHVLGSPRSQLKLQPKWSVRPVVCAVYRKTGVIRYTGEAKHAADTVEGETVDIGVEDGPLPRVYVRM